MRDHSGMMTPAGQVEPCTRRIWPSVFLAHSQTNPSAGALRSRAVSSLARPDRAGAALTTLGGYESPKRTTGSVASAQRAPSFCAFCTLRRAAQITVPTTAPTARTTFQFMAPA